MKVKLQSDSKLRVVKAVMDVLDLSLKEAKDLADERGVKKDDEFYVIIDSEKTEEQVKAVAIGCDVTFTPIDSATTIKITSTEIGPLLDAVMKFLKLSPKEAADFIKGHTVYEPTCKWTCIDVKKPRKEIEMCARNIPGIKVQFLDRIDNVQVLDDVDMAVPEPTNSQKVEQKLQEITDEDLGVSIHSIDEESIGWQCKILFNHKQATRVLAGLHDAKFNVTEALVMYEGNKATMLVITKTFPTGIRKEDLEKFEKLLHTFMYAMCKVVDLEEKIEDVKECAFEAFNELQDYE